jgi:hypothetical protein
MVTREQIEQAKHRRDRAFFQQVLDTRQSVRNLLQVLERLGRLPADFDPAPLLPLTEHPSPEVRLAAIKGLSRLENPDLLPLFTERVQRESNTYVRRELVSAIGRLRLPNAIPFLCRLLHDPDPKVVLQVIRALLCFRQRPEVQAALQPLTDHPNELVRAAVRKAFQPVQTSPSKQPHPASPDWLKNLMVCADVLDMLAHIPSESIHLTFTSPPYYNYKGDLVLDPFAGRGTVGQAALLTERYFLLAEKEPTYFEYARELLSAGNLLTDHTPRFLHYEEFVQLAKEQDQPQCVGQGRQVFC